MTKLNRQFKVILEQDEDGYFVATVPALPGCHTQAKSLSVLQGCLREVILLCLEEAKENADYRATIENLAYEPSFVGIKTIEV